MFSARFSPCVHGYANPSAMYLASIDFYFISYFCQSVPRWKTKCRAEFEYELLNEIKGA
jgi:hypothetical protein